MRYLKIKPDTYSLSRQQMFRFDTCQFCGNKGEHNYRRLLSEHNLDLANNLWKRTCSKCNKTTAIVKRELDIIESPEPKKSGRPKKIYYDQNNTQVEEYIDHYIIKYDALKK